MVMKRLCLLASLGFFLFGAYAVDPGVSGSVIGTSLYGSGQSLVAMSGFLLSFIFYLAGTHHIIGRNDL